MFMEMDSHNGLEKKIQREKQNSRIMSEIEIMVSKKRWEERERDRDTKGDDERGGSGRAREIGRGRYRQSSREAERY